MQDGRTTNVGIEALGLWKGSGKRIRLSVATGSMAPLIRAGDSVQLAMVGPCRLRSGDVIAFLREGRVVVHRLLRMEWGADGIWLHQKGDGLRGGAFVHSDAFIGRVEVVLRGRQVIPMTSGPWRMANRALGVWGRFQAGLFMLLTAGGRRLRRRGRGKGAWGKTQGGV